MNKKLRNSIITSSVILVLLCIVCLCLTYFLPDHMVSYFKTTGWKYFTIGAFAELANGTIGMAYGITTGTALLTMGVSPLMSSSIVHLSLIHI